MDCFGFYDYCFTNFNDFRMKNLLFFLLFLPTLAFTQKQWVNTGVNQEGFNVYRLETVKPTEASLTKNKTFVGYGIITSDLGVEYKYKIYSWTIKSGQKCGYVSIRDKATKTQEIGSLYLKTCKCPN